MEVPLLSSGLFPEYINIDNSLHFLVCLFVVSFGVVESVVANSLFVYSFSYCRLCLFGVEQIPADTSLLSHYNQSMMIVK